MTYTTGIETGRTERRRTGTWLVAIVLAGACSAAPDGDGRATFTDSAGVTLIDLAPAGPGAMMPLSLSPAPLLEIGVADGDPAREFHRISTVRLLSDNSVVVGSNGSDDIRMFGSDGAHLRTIGRSGEGPGEFAGVHWIQVFDGDTIAALDRSLRRVTVFDREGALVTVVGLDGPGAPWPRDVRTEDGAYGVVWELFDVFDRVAAGQVAVGETTRDAAPMMRYDDAGVLLDTIGIFPGVEHAIISNAGRIGASSPPFGRMLSYAFDGGGFWIGAQEAFDIARYTFDGVLTHRIRDLSLDLSLDDGHVLAYAAVLAESRDLDPAARSELDQGLLASPRPPTRAAHGEIRVGPGGRVWVAEAVGVWRLPGFWTVIDPVTGDARRIDMPPGFELFDIAADRVAGVYTDDLDVEHVRVYGLER